MEYENGKIYRLVCNCGCNKQYIGSTKNTLSKRKKQHKDDYTRWSKGLRDGLSAFSFMKHNDYDIILIENFPCNDKNELTARERFFIETMECVNKNIPTRTKKEYRNDNKEKLKAYYIKYRENHKEKIKQYKKQNKEKITLKRKENEEKNKEQIKEKRRKYRIENIEKISKQQKLRYDKNRTKILEQRKEKVVCPMCSKEITKAYLKKHIDNLHTK